MKRLLVLMIGILACWQLGQGGYIQAKALVAQVLLERAWQRTLAGEAEARPWPWADTRAVGRLQLPRQETSLIVLEGTSGRTLAFGPGWDPASGPAGEDGVALIAAHRDTHFEALRWVRAGDEIRFQNPAGQWVRYRVQATQVVDARRYAVRQAQTESMSRLVLATCYPFDDWETGGPLRYIVTAERMAPAVVDSGDPLLQFAMND